MALQTFQSKWAKHGFGNRVKLYLNYPSRVRLITEVRYNFFDYNMENIILIISKPVQYGFNIISPNIWIMCTVRVLDIF